MAIIAILASLLLPAASRAYRLAKGMADEQDSPVVAEMLLNSSRNYCAVNPRFRFESRSDFAEKCSLAPKCRAWIDASTTEFIPFSYLDPTNKAVLVVRFGPKHQQVYSFTRGDLSLRP